MATTKQSLQGEAQTPEPEPQTGPVRVAMLAQISGTRDGAEWPAVGGEIELPADEANQLIKSFLARPVKAPAREPVVEEAAVIEDAPPERAVVSRAHSARPARGGRSKGNKVNG